MALGYTLGFCFGFFGISDLLILVIRQETQRSRAHIKLRLEKWVWLLQVSDFPMAREQSYGQNRFKTCFSWKSEMLIYHDDISSWYIMMIYHHDISWWNIIMIYHDDISSWYIMMVYHHDLSWWYIIMINHDDISSWYIMMIYHHDISWWHIIMTYHDDISSWYIIILCFVCNIIVLSGGWQFFFWRRLLRLGGFGALGRLGGF
jgi:hypothetical protein